MFRPISSSGVYGRTPFTRSMVDSMLLHGSHDWIAPVGLAKAFFDDLNAPYKQFVELPNRAHIATLANSGAILVTLATEVRALATRQYAGQI